MFKDAEEWVKKCESCQYFKGRVQLAALPLKLVVIEEPFQQWGLDFIGPIHPSSAARHNHILMATNYFTKWVEAILVKQTNLEVVCNFIKQNILVRFGVPNKIITENYTNISSFCYQYGIILSHSSNYFTQGNGQVESNNKNIMTIVRKLIDVN